MILAGVTFLVGLHVLGVLIGGALRRWLPIGFFFASGLLWGLAAYALLAALIIALGLPYTPAVMFGGLGLLGAAAAFGALRQGAWSPAERLGAVVSTASCASLAAFFQVVPFALMSADSSGMIIMGRTLALYGGFDPEFAAAKTVVANLGWFSNYGALVPILQSSAVFLGGAYHYALTPLLVISFSATFVYLVCVSVRALGGTLTVALELGLLAAGFMASTFMFAIQAVYIHNSMLSAVYLLLFAAGGWLAVVEDRPAWLLLAIPALLTFCLARLEAPLFAVPLMLMLIAHPWFTYRRRLLCMGVVVAFLLLWHAALYRVTVLPAPDTYMLTRTRNLTSMAGLVAAFCFVALTRWRPVERLLGQAPWLAVFAILTGLLTLWLYEPEHMNSCLHALVTNATRTGAWVASWCALVVLLAFLPALPRVPHQALYSHGLAFAALAIYALGGLKGHRLAWADSQNRMLTHIFPLTVFYVTLRYALAARDTGLAIETLRRRVLRGGLTTAAIVVLVMVVSSSRRDYATEASVLSSFECVEKYGVDAALRESGRFVSAVERCPVTAVIDLGGRRRIELVELELHTLLWAFEDFALHTSRDGLAWDQLYDSRDPNSPPPYLLGETRWGFDGRERDAWRFLRLSVRAAREQNRVVMNRLHCWSTAPRSAFKERATLRVVTPDDWARLIGESDPAKLDLMRGATVVSGPATDPNEAFWRAVDGRPGGGAAAGPGGPPLAFDLGWWVEAAALELESGSDDGSLVVEVSQDGVHWTTLGAPRRDAAFTRWDVSAAGPLRFVRIATGGAGPLRLERVSLFGRTVDAGAGGG